MNSVAVGTFRAPSRSQRTSERGGAHPSALRATTQRIGTAVVVCAGGEVDASNQEAWEHLLTKTAAMVMAPGSFVVDVRQMDFLGCCAFTVLAQQAKRCRCRGVNLCLVSNQPIVAQSVAACGLRPVLPIHATVQAALAQAGGRSSDR